MHACDDVVPCFLYFLKKQFRSIFSNFFCILMMNVQSKRLQRDLNHSEAVRVEAERRADLAVAEATRLADVASQVEETSSENKSLSNQVVGSFTLDEFTCRTSQLKCYSSSAGSLLFSSEGEGAPRQTDQPSE